MLQSQTQLKYITNPAIFETFGYEINYMRHILWQYDNAEVLKKIAQLKTEWYQKNILGFWQYISDSFLNIMNAEEWGITNWGNLLQVNRLYNIQGQDITLSLDLYRRLVAGKFNLLYSNGSIPEINQYLNFVFSNHRTENTIAGFCKDLQNMSVIYNIYFEPNLEELALMYSRDFLPTPAGVQTKIYLFNPSTTFGFFGSGLNTFDNAPFWDGRYI